MVGSKFDSGKYKAGGGCLWWKAGWYGGSCISGWNGGGGKNICVGMV